jgi:hypothetical protein
MATTIVLSDMNTAPTAGGMSRPQGSKNTSGQWDHHHVVSSAPPDVLNLLAIAGCAEFEDARDVEWVVLHQHQVS